MKLRHALMLAALAVAAWLALFGDKTPNANIAEPADRKGAEKPVAASAASPSPVKASDSVAKKPQKPEPAIRALLPRRELIGGASTTNKADPLFASQNWMPPPPPPAKPVAPPPPTAPAIPFTFLGKKLEDAKWEVYLSRGDTTIIVSESTVVDATYRIDSIKPPNLTMTYLPLNQTQVLPIGGIE